MPIELSCHTTIGNTRLVDLAGLTTGVAEWQRYRTTLEFSEGVRVVPFSGEELIDDIEFDLGDEPIDARLKQRSLEFVASAICEFNMWSTARNIQVDGDGDKLFEAERLEEPPTEVVTINATNGGQTTKLHVFNFGDRCDDLELDNLESLVRRTIAPFKTGVPDADSYLMMVDTPSAENNFARGLHPFMMSRGFAQLPFRYFDDEPDLLQQQIYSIMCSVLFRDADNSRLNTTEGELESYHSVEQYGGEWGMRVPLAVTIEPVD